MQERGNRDLASDHRTFYGGIRVDGAGRNFFRSNYAWKKRRKSPINTLGGTVYGIWIG